MKVDVLEILRVHGGLDDVIAVVAELIERDKETQKIFDCILRAINDTSGDMGHRSLQYLPSWLESWAKSMLAAGFNPSNPDAGDIKRALAKVQP